MSTQPRAPLAPDDPVHVLGQKIVALVEIADVEVATNALLVNLKVVLMNMDDRQAAAFQAGIDRFIGATLVERALWRARPQPGAVRS